MLRFEHALLIALTPLALAATSGCAGNRQAGPTKDAGVDRRLAFFDVDPIADLMVNDSDGLLDVIASDTQDPNDAAFPQTCTAMTSDGIHLNPGCDPDVKSTGIDAISSALDTTTSLEQWLVLKGKKWWSYGTAVGSTTPRFLDGGKDVAAFLRALQPSCASKTKDGIALNPGCDPSVQVNGLTALGSATDAGGQTAWLATSGKNWWIYGLDSSKVARFVDGGRDVAAFCRALAPSCSARTSDGIALNPGCDPTVQANGFSALGSATDGKATSWIVVSSKRWWVYGKKAGSSTAAFIDGGKSVATLLTAFQPGCGARTADGTPLNPGCDPAVQVNGLKALSSMSTVAGRTAWIATSGKKWWILDGQPAAFSASGKDIASLFRTLQP